MHRYSVRFLGHILTFSPFWRLWHITGPLVNGFENQLSDATELITWSATHQKPIKTTREDALAVAL